MESLLRRDQIQRIRNHAEKLESQSGHRIKTLASPMGPELYERVPLEIVRQVLQLDELPYQHVLTQQCWFLGSITNRWLLGELTQGDVPMSADVDVWFPGREAADALAFYLLDAGFVLTGISRQRRILLPAGSVRHLHIGRQLYAERFAANPNIKIAVFESHTGRRLHLHFVFFVPSPIYLLNEAAFRVTQFAIDREHVYSTELAWLDLADKRLHLRKLQVSASRHFRKYIRRGFHPDASCFRLALLPLVFPLRYARIQLDREFRRE